MPNDQVQQPAHAGETLWLEESCIAWPVGCSEWYGAAAAPAKGRWHQSLSSSPHLEHSRQADERPRVLREPGQIIHGGL